MIRQELLASIKEDLGANYNSDDVTLLESIYNEVVDNALRFSNRIFKSNKETQVDVLASEIRRCVKTIYLSRGAEDVSSKSQSGLTSTYDDAMERMRNDIVKNGKRVLI